MDDWIRHTYRKWKPRLTVKEGAASLRNSEDDAEPVNDVPVAGFARPLPTKTDQPYVEPYMFEL